MKAHNNWSVTLTLSKDDTTIRRNVDTGTIQVRSITMTPWERGRGRVHISGPAVKKDKTLALFERQGSMPIDELPDGWRHSLDAALHSLGVEIDDARVGVAV